MQQVITAANVETIKEVIAFAACERVVLRQKATQLEEKLNNVGAYIGDWAGLQTDLAKLEKLESQAEDLRKYITRCHFIALEEGEVFHLPQAMAA